MLLRVGVRNAGGNGGFQVGVSWTLPGGDEVRGGDEERTGEEAVCEEAITTCGCVAALRMVIVNLACCKGVLFVQVALRPGTVETAADSAVGSRLVGYVLMKADLTLCDFSRGSPNTALTTKGSSLALT